MTELKDRLKETIEDIGPDAAQELADRMHEEERLVDDTYESIKRQIRLKRDEASDNTLSIYKEVGYDIP